MRALAIGLMVLGLMGIPVMGITSPATPANKVVIGVLDFEMAGGLIDVPMTPLEQKKALMRELRRNTRVKLVDIRESCSLSNLKRHEYGQAEEYKNIYHVDMILHIYMSDMGFRGGTPIADSWEFYFSLIDLYTKKVKEVSIEIRGTSLQLGFKGISRKILVSKDLNRVLGEKKEVLGKKEVVVTREVKESPKRETKEIPPPAPSINKVVIGVLDFEMAGGLIDVPMTPPEQKKALMRELKRNARVKLVDIHGSCSLSNLKRDGYGQAEEYKNIYHVDMILHIYMSDMGFRGGTPIADSWEFYFSLIDLYTKKVKEVSIEIRGTSLQLGFKGISRKILVSKDLNRVLRAKKKVQGVKEVAVPRKVGESPEKIEAFLIQYGPRLIAEDQYNRVLELIEDLPGRRRRHIQIRTLECFANLKGWVCDKDKYCKVSWSKLRQKLIDSEDNEATAMLVIFLKDEDQWMRIYAAELLGHIGNKRALQDLREAGENDENRKVRKYAKRAYEQISGEKF